MLVNDCRRISKKNVLDTTCDNNEKNQILENDCNGDDDKESEQLDVKDEIVKASITKEIICNNRIS